jgi:threonine dehydratase
MRLPSLDQIRDAQSALYRDMGPTPEYSWPLVNRRLGCEAWIKHENHTPVGAFKLRGALLYLDWLKQSRPGLKGVVAATRGNHGQGVGFAARRFGLDAVVVVPYGNSREKNRAMLALGVELIEHGDDFQAALEFARTLAEERGFALVESFHERLVLGTSTYALEFFSRVPWLDRIYVPVGLGSSIAGVAAARNALGLATEIIGVVAARSPSYARSFAAGRAVEAAAETVVADGLACRRPHEEALAILLENVTRIVEVSETEIFRAMGALYEDTHNLAEGAGAAALAAAIQQRDQLGGRRIGLVLTGANVDRQIFLAALEEGCQFGSVR